MTIRNYELTGLISLEDVAEVLKTHLAYGPTHQIDLGDFGVEDFECDYYIDGAVILNELARRVRSEP